MRIRPRLHPERKIHARGRLRRLGGFSYVEVLIATALISLALAPALDALIGGIQGAGIHVTMAEEHYHLLGGLEQVLAEPFDELDAEALAVGDPAVATAYSDASGTPRRRLVFLARYDGDDADADGDPFTGGDDGLLWVAVELEHTGRVLESLTSR